MKIAKRWWIGLAFLCAAMMCAAPFLIGALTSGKDPLPTNGVTEAEKAGLVRATGLALPVSSRFLLYDEDNWLDAHTYYKLRLTDGDLQTFLAQRTFRGATWGREVETAGAASFPGWNPGRRPKTRSTQVTIERKPEGATYLNIMIDPNEDGTNDVYLKLGYS